MYWLTVNVVSLMVILLSSVSAETLDLGVRNMPQKKLHAAAFTLVEEAGKQIGVEVKFHYYPTKRSLKLANSGLLDGEMLRHKVIEPLYPNLLRVDQAIDSFDYWVWVSEDKPCMVDTMSLQTLKPVGLSGVAFYRTEVYPLSQVGYEQATNNQQLLNLLQRNRADYTVQSQRFMENLTAHGDFKVKTCLEQPLFSMPFYIYLHQSKRHLVVDFGNALANLKAQQ